MSGLFDKFADRLFEPIIGGIEDVDFLKRSVLNFLSAVFILLALALVYSVGVAFQLKNQLFSTVFVGSVAWAFIVIGMTAYRMLTDEKARASDLRRLIKRILLLMTLASLVILYVPVFFPRYGLSPIGVMLIIYEVSFVMRFVLYKRRKAKKEE